MVADPSEYGLSKQVQSAATTASDLPYLPQLPATYRPKIGLVGAGGVSEYHLRAYGKLGLEVIVICDVDLERARRRRDEFFPKATICSRFAEVVRRGDVEVIDVALHPEHRLAVLEAALEARKHVLSQKPFALDLDEAGRLADLADARGVKLAINQNGRWAPHFAYALAAVRAGLLGEIGTVDFNLSFDHSWTIGTPFENIHHLLLYDFGVHWFDLASCFLQNREAKSVYATVSRTAYQKARPPFVAAAVIDGAGVQIRLAFNAAVKYGQIDRTVVAGSLGTLESSGPSLSEQKLKLSTAAGVASPELVGTWFENGFQGTMCELLCAIAENRQPQHSARNNLRTLALCFAALQSANSGQPVKPGEVRKLPT
ncbi:MAG TPA: Gfo/Idh/MocA family oxidoreductase [Patescibacteria group bacterium]|nr:Gfo/Idh/MocA family oxidoreductase [Patescibacteria group bacterium]